MCFFCYTLQNELFAQQAKPLATNLWYAAHWNTTLDSNWSTSLDVGYRSCSNFVEKRKQILARASINLTVLPKLQVGIGFAYFNHKSPVNDVVREELRPFLQLRYAKTVASWQVNVRFREEYRSYEDRALSNFRSRMQVQVVKKHTRYLAPYAAIELFASKPNTRLLESRISLGTSIHVTKSSALSLFYTLQNQEKIPLNQHIIGVQYTLTSKPNG